MPIEKKAVGYFTDATGGFVPTLSGSTPYDTQRIAEAKQQQSKGITDKQSVKYQADQLDNTLQAATAVIPGTYAAKPIAAGIGRGIGQAATGVSKALNYPFDLAYRLGRKGFRKIPLQIGGKPLWKSKPGQAARLLTNLSPQSFLSSTLPAVTKRVPSLRWLNRASRKAGKVLETAGDTGKVLLGGKLAGDMVYNSRARDNNLPYQFRNKGFGGFYLNENMPVSQRVSEFGSDLVDSLTGKSKYLPVSKNNLWIASNLASGAKTLPGTVLSSAIPGFVAKQLGGARAAVNTAASIAAEFAPEIKTYHPSDSTVKLRDGALKNFGGKNFSTELAVSPFYSAVDDIVGNAGANQGRFGNVKTLWRLAKAAYGSQDPVRYMMENPRDTLDMAGRGLRFAQQKHLPRTPMEKIMFANKALKFINSTGLSDYAPSSPMQLVNQANNTVRFINNPSIDKFKKLPVVDRFLNK